MTHTHTHTHMTHTRTHTHTHTHRHSTHSCAVQSDGLWLLRVCVCVHLCVYLCVYRYLNDPESASLFMNHVEAMAVADHQDNAPNTVLLEPLMRVGYHAHTHTHTPKHTHTHTHTHELAHTYRPVETWLLQQPGTQEPRAPASMSL